MSERATCPCCGYRTLSRPCAYEVCQVCLWEDDGMSTLSPTESGEGPNGISLAEGQRRYRRYGSAHLDSLEIVRPPKSDEPLDPDWTPHPPPRDEGARHDFLRDLGWLLLDKAREAGAQARRDGDAEGRGRLRAYREVIDLLTAQGELFGLSRDDLGLPSGDLVAQELLADEPSDGHFAG